MAGPVTRRNSGHSWLSFLYFYPYGMENMQNCAPTGRRPVQSTALCKCNQGRVHRNEMRQQRAAAASKKEHAVASGQVSSTFDPNSPWVFGNGQSIGIVWQSFQIFCCIYPSLSSKLGLTCCVSFRQPFLSFAVYQVSNLSPSSLLLRFRLFVRSHGKLAKWKKNATLAHVN